MKTLMIDLNQVRSLTDFQRNARKHVTRLRQTGKPEVLTVNGRAQVVVQSSKAYQQLIDDAELAHSLRVIRKSLREARAGRTQSAKPFLRKLAAKHGIDLQK